MKNRPPRWTVGGRRRTRRLLVDDDLRGELLHGQTSLAGCHGSVKRSPSASETDATARWGPRVVPGLDVDEPARSVTARARRSPPRRRRAGRRTPDGGAGSLRQRRVTDPPARAHEPQGRRRAGCDAVAPPRRTSPGTVSAGARRPAFPRPGPRPGGGSTPSWPAAWPMSSGSRVLVLAQLMIFRS